MNSRLIKESRALLPAFGLAIAAALLAALMGPKKHELPEICMGLLFVLGCMIMAAETFGSEFQQKTLNLLLTQPIPRTRIWREKMQVLALGLAVATGMLSLVITLLHRQAFADAGVPWQHFGLFALGIFCTTPYWTLLFQNSLMGLLLTGVAPIALMAANSLMLMHWFQYGTQSIFASWFALNQTIHHWWMRNAGAEESSGITLLTVYCVSCFWLGYRKFKKLQVVDGPSTLVSRELTLPPRVEALLVSPLESVNMRSLGPWASLAKKELRIQQVTFGVGILFTLMVVSWAASFPLHHGLNWTGALLVCAFVFYVAIVPLIAGTVAVAEEKAWGVAEWQLTLPPSLREQWLTKVVVALGTSLILGLFLPVVFLLAGGLVLEPGGQESLPSFHGLRLLVNSVLGGPASSLASFGVTITFLFCIVLGHLLFTSIAIYAGSMVRNTARALVLALGMMVVGGLLISFCRFIAFDPRDLTLRVLAALPHLLVRSQTTVVTLLAMAMIFPLCVILYFAYRCYRARGMTLALFKIQLPGVLVLIWLIALACIAFASMSRVKHQSRALRDNGQQNIFAFKASF